MPLANVFDDYFTTQFQQRSSDNEVPKPFRATSELPPAELGDKNSKDSNWLRKIGKSKILTLLCC
jgi:hypothetical protein